MSNAESKDVRAEMVRAQDPDPLMQGDDLFPCLPIGSKFDHDGMRWEKMDDGIALHLESGRKARMGPVTPCTNIEKPAEKPEPEVAEKPSRRSSKKPRAEEAATYTVGCTTVTCPAKTRPGHAVRVAKAVQRLLKEMSARGEWGIAYNRVHVPPQERGRARKK